MGFILSKIIEFFTRSRNNFKIIILGMQNAGKTTILYRLSLGQLVKTTPTIGSNMEELQYENVKFQAWDLGGQESTRSVWDIYYMNTDGVIYVIDGAKTINQIIQDYELDKIKNHSWQIQPCSALRGEGLIEGLKWLSEQLVFRGKNNFPNNPYENNENEEKEDDKKINKSNMINSENSESKINVMSEMDNNTNININAEQHKENVNEVENSENNINNEIIVKNKEV